MTPSTPMTECDRILYSFPPRLLKLAFVNENELQFRKQLSDSLINSVHSNYTVFFLPFRFGNVLGKIEVHALCAAGFSDFNLSERSVRCYALSKKRKSKQKETTLKIHLESGEKTHLAVVLKVSKHLSVIYKCTTLWLGC